MRKYKETQVDALPTDEPLIHLLAAVCLRATVDAANGSCEARTWLDTFVGLPWEGRKDDCQHIQRITQGAQ